MLVKKVKNSYFVVNYEIEFDGTSFTVPRYSENGNGWWAGTTRVKYNQLSLRAAINESLNRDWDSPIEGEYFWAIGWRQSFSMGTQDWDELIPVN